MVAPLGGQISGDPSAVRNRDGRLEVFAPLMDGTPGDVWQMTAGGVWSQWVPFGGATTKALVGTNNADGHLVLIQLGGRQRDLPPQPPTRVARSCSQVA